MKIKRERAFTYLFMFLLLGIIILGLYFVNVKLTGQVIYDEYTNQTACEDADYTWENLTNETCTNVTVYVNETIESCLEYEIINETTNETTNETGDCINWTSYINETSTIEEQCVDVVIGGQCVGDVCDSAHLNLCDETNCSGAGGYWYNDICNAEEEPECSSNSDCASGYECNSNGVCVEETDGEDEEVPEETIGIPQVTQNEFILSAADIQPLSIAQGSSKEVKWLITNAGTSPLNKCKMENLGGEDSRLSFSGESFTLNPGEQREFAFDVTIPEETAQGDYSLRVFLKCDETFAMKDFNVNVFKKEIEFELIDAQRIRKDRVRVFYNLEELSGNDQDVEIGFFLLNQDDQRVSEIKENKTLSANSVKEFRTTMEINESLMPVDESTNESIESNLTLIIDLNSEIYSSSVQERITLGAPIGGFAVFEGIGTGGLIAIIVILVSGVAFFVVRKIRKNKTK